MAKKGNDIANIRENFNFVLGEILKAQARGENEVKVHMVCDMADLLRRMGFRASTVIHAKWEPDVQN